MENIVQGLVAWKVYLVFGWIALFFLLERVYPAAREGALPGAAAQPAEGGLPRLGRNAALWACNAVLSLAVVLPITAWAAGNSFFLRPEALRGWSGLLLDLILLDMLIYWWHRANHRIGFLWRFHQVHHLDRFLDSTSALRFHFGEVLLSALARAAVVLVFAIPFSSVVVFEILLLLATVFHHSNLRLPARLEGALGRVIITPAIHWVHHHAVQRDTDSNYGTFFSFWDRLFGSRNPMARALDMEIGVQGRCEGTLFGLLLRPFVAEREGRADRADRQASP